MPPKQRSPWIYVLGILIILLIVVVVLVLRASKKITPVPDTSTINDTSNSVKNDTKTPITYVPNPTTTTTTTSATIAGQALVTALDIQLLESFPVQVTAVVQGSLADPCVTLGQPVVSYVATTKKFSLFMPTSRPVAPTTACAQVTVPYTKSIPLNVVGFSAGSYSVTAGTQTKTFTLDTDNVLDISSGK